MCLHTISFSNERWERQNPIKEFKPGEATSPNLYMYVWLKFGGKWVPFQSKVEQEGYTEMGMFWGPSSNIGTIFSIHMKQLHAYIMRDTLTGLTF